MSRTLHLHVEHAKLGASFAIRGDAELVAGYRGLPEEYRALVEKVGVSDRSYRGLLRVAGPEAASYLHGMVTNDVKGLAVGEGNLSTIIHARGKMLGEARVFVPREGEVLLDVPPEAREALARHLDQYLISEDCELSDVTGRLIPLGAWGPAARELVEGILGGAIPELPENHLRVVSVAGGEAFLVASAPDGIPGFELWCGPEAASSLWARMVEGAEESGGLPVGDRALDAARIRRGIPRWGDDLDEDTIPLEANLQHAISYTKGCYVGQEVIAKATYRGAVRRKLARMEVSHGATRGASLLDGGVLVGTLTSVLDPDPAGDQPAGLGYVRRDRLEVGKTLALEGGGEARIVWIPEEERK